jgi:hypothetical protein
MRRTSRLSLTVFSALSLICIGAEKKPAERWDGKVFYGKQLQIPFSMQIEFDAPRITGVIVAGDERVVSTSGTMNDDAVVLKFDPLGTTLEGKLDGGSFKGTYGKAGAESAHRQKVELGRFCTCGFQGEAGPDISGVWNIEGGGKLSVQRKGEDTFAHLEIPNDSRQFGTLSGRFDGVSFTLSHFNGTRAALLDAEPGKNAKKMDLNFQLPGEVARKFVATRTH